MNTQTLTFDSKTNVGTVDRYIRFSAGFGLIAVPLLYEGVDVEWAAITSLLAIPLLFTAMASWCPVYAFFHLQSIRHEYQSDRYYARNIGLADIVFRYALGSALILVTMLYSSAENAWLVIPALAAIPVIGSAIMQWDPVYAVFEVGTHSHRVTYREGGAEVIPISDSSATLPNRPLENGTVKAA